MQEALRVEVVDHLTGGTLRIYEYISVRGAFNYLLVHINDWRGVSRIKGHCAFQVLERGGVGDLWDKRALTGGGMVVRGSGEGMAGYFPSCDRRRP